MDPNPIISVQNKSIAPPEEESKKIIMEFPLNMPARLSLNCGRPEEDDDNIEKNFSPSKYFGKRPSFEYKNLKTIEKIFRIYSLS